MKQHTPGPWAAFKYPDVKTFTVAAKESVASKIQTVEDANLIAAAPDMLLALEGFVRQFESGILPHLACEKAKEAIAKAKGIK